MFRTMMIFSVASMSAALPVFVEDKPADSPSSLKEKIHGAWKGYGPCDGDLTLNANGTYARKWVGPGGDSDSGTWSLKWDALPPTLTFECEKADSEELEGRSIPGKLVRLDDDGMEILYDGSSQPIVFRRVEK